MTHLAKNIGCTIALVVSDFISFVLSLYLAVGLLAVSMTDLKLEFRVNNLILGFCYIYFLECVVSLGMV